MKPKTIAQLAVAITAIALPFGTFAQDGPPEPEPDPIPDPVPDPVPPEPQPDFRPDSIIGKPVRTDAGIQIRWVGDNVYNHTGHGQGIRGEATLRRAANYAYNLENDGAANDAFRILGTRGNRFFRVGYFGANGNLTAAITGDGLPTGEIAAGESIRRPIRIVVKAKPRAFIKAGKRARKHILTSVAAVSRGAGTPPLVDRVLAGTRLVRQIHASDVVGDRKPSDRRPEDRRPADRQHPDRTPE